MALMKRANREINVPEEYVEEYLEKGYSLIDSKGTVLKASNPQTIEDFRGLVAALKDKVSCLESEKTTLLEERDVMIKHIEELTAEVEKLKTPAKSEKPSKPDKT